MSVRRTRNSLALSVFIVALLVGLSPILSQPAQITSLEFPILEDSYIGAADVQDYVDTDTSDVDGSADIGAHSGFANQQLGPDSVFDTLLEANDDPSPTDSEDDVDSNTSDLDSFPDIGTETLFANAQGTTLDSSYMNIEEVSAGLGYGGETGLPFVTGSVPDFGDKDQYCRYQALFWNPTDYAYEITRVEFNYTGGQWLNAIQQGSGSSSPTSGWLVTGKNVAYWSGAPLYVRPHDIYPFHVSGDSNRFNGEFMIDLRITANGTTYSRSYHSEQTNGNSPGAQLWLGNSLPPQQNHTVAPDEETTIYVSLEEDANKLAIDSGGTLTIDVPSEFTSIEDIGGSNWGTAVITGNTIDVGNTASIKGSFITYAFNLTAPSIPGLYMLNVAFEGTSGGSLWAHPIGNFTIRVTGVQPETEQLDLEYQWTSADFDETNEEVCIYVGSHTGAEDLNVSYWSGSDWSLLGTISSTGWTNLTATGLTSTTYTIQLMGASETADASKDNWDIDLITLHVWSSQTFNYKLDLEVQWTSAIFDDTNEELCIYAGVVDAEGIRVDVWTGAGWTNVLADLSQNSWNNVSVVTWLTSATFTIRFRGDFEAGDTLQSSWDIDCTLLHTWSNYAPQNVASPTVSNIDDGSYLYGRYKDYQITVYVNDTDGFADIDYVELTLTSDDTLTEYWTIRYDEDTGIFSETADPGNYVSLNAGSSSASKSGSEVNVTFHVAINWDHPVVADTDAKCYVVDQLTMSNEDYFEINWDVETKLDLSDGPNLADGSGTQNRGDLDGSLTASGTVTYLGSTLHPLASEIDVHVSASEYGSTIGPWEAINYEDTGGTYSVTVYADDVVGQDTFTVKAVAQGVGVGGIDLLNSTETVQYIVDRVQVQFMSTDDSRIDIDASASLHVVLYYEFDGTYVANGSVTVNSISATYSLSNGVWDFSDSKSSAQMATYDSVVYSGGVHGLTLVDQNGQSVNQVWDRIEVVSYTVVDARVNIDDNINIDVTLRYEYDGTAVVDGTVTVNSLGTTYQGGGVWRATDTKSTVQNATYDNVTSTGNANGITVVNQNGQSQLLIWDQITVLSYTADDERVNINDLVSVDVSIEYTYDNTAVDDGVVVINAVTAVYQGSGIWRINVSKSTVQHFDYDTVTCSGNTHGISSVNQNSQSQRVIWDQIIVRGYSVTDSRDNVNDNITVTVELEYKYDSADVVDGTVTINSISFDYSGALGEWFANRNQSIVMAETYDSVAVLGNFYGITATDQNGQSQTIIWDQIIVRGYSVTDSRDNVNDIITVTVELEYKYDSADVTDGDVSVNSIIFAYTGALGEWYADRSQSIVMAETYDSVTVLNNAYGITTVDQNAQSQTIIWDRIQVLTTTVDDARLDVGANCEIHVTLWLEYDGTLLGSGDSVVLDGVAMTWNSGDSRFELNRSQATVGMWSYYVNSSVQATYGISALDLNGNSVNVIWDQIIVESYSVADNRVNIDDSVNIDVTIKFEYDDYPVENGTVSINSIVASPLGNGIWRIIESKSTVQGITYDTVACSGNTLGISSVNQNGQSQLVIWDQLNVYIQADSDTVQNDVQVNFTLTVTFEYDTTPCTTYTLRIVRNSTYWHTFTNANKSQFIDSNSDLKYNYTASIVLLETTYGITVFTTNLETVVWGGSTDAPVNDVAPELANPDDTDFMYARLRYYYISSNVSDAQGYSDISYVELSLWDNTATTEIWRVRFNQTSNEFTVELGSEHIDLAVWSSFVKSGTSIDITWVVKIDWDHADFANVDTKQYVVDAALLSDENWYESDWDVETRLDYSIMPSLSDARGNLNTNDLVGTGTVVYFGSSLHPLANETDVWVVHDVSGTWSADVDGSGAFSNSSIGSSVIVRLNTYTFKVVASGAGFGGTDLYHGASVTDGFITDQIEFYQAGVIDSRININSLGLVWWKARFDYDNVAIESGLSASLNGSKTLLWDGVNSRWYYEENVATVDRVGYSVLSASETTYGISGWTQTTADVSIIWDQITVRSYAVLDDRVNIGTTVNVDVTVEYEYDDTPVVDGVVIVNSVSAVNQGSGVWRIVDSQGTVSGVTYDTVTCIANTPGITAVNQNSQSQLVVWDQITVRSYDVRDNRVNLDDTVYINVTVWYEYDDSPVDDGLLTINGVDATHLISGIWRIAQNRSTVQSVIYDSVACFDNAYNITSVNQNSLSQTLIWDEITVRSYTVLDERVDINQNVNVDVTIEYEYDDTPVSDGTVIINAASASNLVGGVWRITQSSAIVQHVNYSSVTCSGNAHGITSVNQNDQNRLVIWDQITVRSYTVADSRVNVGLSVNVNVTIEYEYDDTPVTDGIVIINSALASSLGGGIWRVTRTENTVLDVLYDVVACSGNLYGIVEVNQNGQNQTIIWDMVTVRSYTVLDSRVNTGSTVDIDVLVEYEYDDTPVISGSVSINGVPALHQVAGIWRINRTSGTVQSETYDSVTCSGNAYDITSVDQNSQSQSVVWDQLVITITPSETSVFNYDQVTFSLTVEFDYDDSACESYTVLIGRNATPWVSFSFSNISLFNDTNLDLMYEYSALGVTQEALYSITAFVTNSANVTWVSAANYAPVNDASPQLVNPDDASYMYSRFGFYFLTSNVSDLDGYADIEYVELSLWDDVRITEVWRVRFTENDNSFSIELGSEYIHLASWSFYLKSGNQLEVIWVIKIDWDHPDLRNTDTKQYALDSSAASIENWYEANWDTESRLDYSVVPSLSDDRGNVDTTDLVGSGTVVYYGSLLHPLSNETDVWAIHDFSGSWSGDVDGAGDFTITGIGSSTQIRLNTYTFKVVQTGSGPTGQDLFRGTSATDDFITDRIEFYDSGVVDERININTDGDVWWRARYEYDGTDVTSGLGGLLNGSKALSWDSANSWWHHQESRFSAQRVGYRIISVAEALFGITGWNQSSADQYVIWDSLRISIVDPDDQRIDIGSIATNISASAVYAYDLTPFDGVLSLNNTVFQYATVQKQAYAVTGVTGGTYNISAISRNDITWCVWDRVQVVSIFTNVTYLDPGKPVQVTVVLQYEFDGLPVTEGIFDLKFESLTHTGSGVWECNVTRPTYQPLSFDDLTAVNASLHNISEYTMAGNSRTVYWDRLEFFTSSALDSRIDVNANGFAIWGVRLENAGVTISTGLVAMATGSSSLAYVSSNWQSTHILDTVGSRSFGITFARLGEITQFVHTSNNVTIIWDQIVVMTTSASELVVNVFESTQITATLVYEYDGTPVTDGIVYLSESGNQTEMNYDSVNGYWFVNVTRETPANYTFFVLTASGNEHGITVLDVNDLSVTVRFVMAPFPMLEFIMATGGFSVLILIIGIIAVRRRLSQLELPFEVKQLEKAIAAIEAGEEVELEDIKTLDDVVMQTLGPGLAELGILPEDVHLEAMRPPPEPSEIQEPEVDAVEEPVTEVTVEEIEEVFVEPEVEEVEEAIPEVPEEIEEVVVEPGIEEVEEAVPEAPEEIEEVVIEPEVEDVEEAIPEAPEEIEEVVIEPEVEDVEEAIPEAPEEIEEAVIEPEVEEVEEAIPEIPEEIEEDVFEPEVDEIEEAVPDVPEETEEDVFESEVEELEEAVPEPLVDELDEEALEAVEEAIIEIDADMIPEVEDTELEPSGELSDMMSDALTELGLIDAALTKSVPLTKADWIQALPPHIKDHFFEEELRQLEIEDLEDLSRLTPAQLEELLGSLDTKDGTDRIEIDESAKTISGALKEVSRPVTKKERIEALPLHIRESMSYERLEAMSDVDLEELVNLSPEEFEALLRTLKKHKDWQDV